MRLLPVCNGHMTVWSWKADAGWERGEAGMGHVDAGQTRDEETFWHHHIPASPLLRVAASPLPPSPLLPQPNLVTS